MAQIKKRAKQEFDEKKYNLVLDVSSVSYVQLNFIVFLSSELLLILLQILLRPFFDLCLSYVWIDDNQSKNNFL